MPYARDNFSLDTGLVSESKHGPFPRITSFNPECRQERTTSAIWKRFQYRFIRSNLHLNNEVRIYRLVIPNSTGSKQVVEPALTITSTLHIITDL
jgi:hypothetical protein